MNIRRRRKGVILLQTLVMSVVLSLMSVMVLKWVLGRYMLAARAYRSTKSFSHSEGYSGRVTSNWNFGGSPGAGSLALDGQTVNVTVSAPLTDGSYRVTYDSDEEDITN